MFKHKLFISGPHGEEEEIKKREIFLLAGGFKAVCTWHRSETLQITR